MSASVRPHRGPPTRLPCPWDSPGKNTGVGCHFLLQCMKVKSESEVAQSCPTLSNSMDCSLPGSSVHGIFQATLRCHCLLRIICYISSTLRCFFFSYFNFSETGMHLQLMTSCNYNWLCFFFLAIPFFKQCTLELMVNPRVNTLQDGWSEDAQDVAVAVASGVRKQR